MINFDGILFDLDGTLLDTAPDLGNALNYVLAQYDQPSIPYQQYRIVASDGAKGLLELGFKEKLMDIDFEHARNQLLEYYNDNICVDTTPFEGVIELLENLNIHKIPWGIVTNKPEKLTLSLLEYFPVMGNCACVVSGDTLPCRKPDPLPLIHAAEVLNLNPNKTLYVGDAYRDIEAARNAKMFSAIAQYGYIAQEVDQNSWQADYKIQHVKQICALK